MRPEWKIIVRLLLLSSLTANPGVRGYISNRETDRGSGGYFSGGDGIIESCHSDITNHTARQYQCPDPFPSFVSSPTCQNGNTDNMLNCRIAVVGAGTGGIYTAMRLVDENKFEAGDICMFEATDRVGGRILSLRGFGPNGDLTVDAGSYRTWPEITPRMHALITEYLNIPMECYQDNSSSVECTQFNIVDDRGIKAGFSTFVEVMMEKLIQAGACFYPRFQLRSLHPETDDSTTTNLIFANGAKATVSVSTILNLPQRPLLNILRRSAFPPVEIKSTTIASATNYRRYYNGIRGAEPPNQQNQPSPPPEKFAMTGRIWDAFHSVQTRIVTKLYLYYGKGNVWWYKLGLRNGQFRMVGDARRMPLEGRYHDGHVICDEPNDVNTCHGFLLAVYNNDLSGNNAQFFRRYQKDRPDPVTILSNTDVEGNNFLSHAHRRLVEYHIYENAASSDNNQRPYSGYEAQTIFRTISQPEFGVLATWNIAVPWAGGGWHSWTDIDNADVAISALSHWNIHLVNEAYSYRQGWAEGSLLAADDVLSKAFDVSPPWALSDVQFDLVIQDVSNYTPEPTTSGRCVGGGLELTNPSSTTEERGDANSNNNNGNGGFGGTTDFCFTSSAMIRMSNGMIRPICKVKVGDYVDTGTGNGDGLITAVLIHPVNRLVELVSIHEYSHATRNNTEVTAYPQHVYGTPSHPILLPDGEWMELGDIIRMNHKTQARSSLNTSLWAFHTQFVDSLYNLEIDGHRPGSSSHSYVVNGIVASGLGNNRILNTMFPRQSSIKQKS